MRVARGMDAGRGGVGTPSQGDARRCGRGRWMRQSPHAQVCRAIAGVGGGVSGPCTGGGWGSQVRRRGWARFGTGSARSGRGVLNRDRKGADRRAPGCRRPPASIREATRNRWAILAPLAGRGTTSRGEAGGEGRAGSKSAPHLPCWAPSPRKRGEGGRLCATGPRPTERPSAMRKGRGQSEGQHCVVA